jgi:FkbM family methyltransferase
MGKRVFIRTYESPEWLRYFSLEKGDVVIDAGANVGIFTQIASNLVGEEGLVIAVEPSQSNLAIIKDHLASASNTEVVGIALMDFNGTDRIQIDPNDRGAASLVADLTNRRTNIIKQRTELSTLDALVKEHGVNRVDLLKIDVEGAEIKLLNGGLRTLDKTEKVIVEADHYAGQSEKTATSEIVRRLLDENGFYTKLSSDDVVYASRNKDSFSLQ